ncbi:MAG: ABC transporter ATP-binding protein [Pseudomonadota bacterium]
MSEIRLEGVELGYPLTTAHQRSLKSVVQALIGRRAERPRTYHALQGIDLTIRAGERVGIIGENGAGKTTLLKLIAGIYPASSGEVYVSGRISTLLDLAVGMDLERTGLENILARLYVMGVRRREAEDMVEGIAEFADLGEFIDQPVRVYSSGMFVRLAFSIAINTQPEILLLDEFLSAGDAKFFEKAEMAMDQLAGRGNILVVASHSMPLVEAKCNRAIWIEHGQIMKDGPPSQVVDAYLTASRGGTV